MKEAEMRDAEAALAAKVESVERAISELREEIAAFEAPRVKSGVELASRIAGREVTREELIERGRELGPAFEQRLGEQPR